MDSNSNSNNSIPVPIKQISSCTDIYTRLYILSATYGPAEGRKLLDGKTVVDYTEKHTFIPYTRNVLPFLRALMIIMMNSNSNNSNNNCTSTLDDECGTDDEKRDHHEDDYYHEFDIDNNDELSADATCSQDQFQTTPTTTTTNSFPLMDGQPMNAVFGDPCPGTTKLLRVEYVFRDYYFYATTATTTATDRQEQEKQEGNDYHNIGSAQQQEGCNEKRTSNNTIQEAKSISNSNSSSGSSCSINHDGRRKRKQHNCHCTTSRIFHSTFREHERVLLKRQDPLLFLDNTTSVADAEAAIPNDTVEIAKQPIHIMQLKSNNDNDNDEKTTSGIMIPIIATSSSITPKSSSPSIPKQSEHLGLCNNSSSPSSSSSSPSKQQRWKLAPTTSEITLPIILPFLTIRERASCQLVCTSWRDIVLEKGIASVVDVNDVSLFPKDNAGITITATTTSQQQQEHQQQQQSSVFIRQSPLSDVAPTQGGSTTGLQMNDSATPSNAGPAVAKSTSSSSSLQQEHPSRALLRGLINHSHSSLEALVLNDFHPLQPIIDLHPALPFLRKLKRVDISRIPSITDTTLQLLSTSIGLRLEVLYMKGLKHISNNGIVTLVQSCCNLRVLDVSQLHQMDDEAGIAIGQNLLELEVLHGKDNYRLTNRSVDVITRNCRKLVQVGFWGYIKMNDLCFDSMIDQEQSTIGGGENDSMTATADAASSSMMARSVGDHHPSSSTSLPQITSLNNAFVPSKLILLNLWGCYNLADAASTQMSNLTQLRSLCVSECHRLTDRFVLGVTKSLPQLMHLQLRYLCRITDASLDSISYRMTGLYTLDVSFCSKLTVKGLAHLLRDRCNSLMELRVYSCRQLNLEGGGSAMNDGNNNRRSGVVGGRQLVQALRAVQPDSTLSFLDLRNCQTRHEPFARDDVFLNGMIDLGFHEALHGLFIRRIQWNEGVKKQIVRGLSMPD